MSVRIRGVLGAAPAIETDASGSWVPVLSGWATVTGMTGSPTRFAYTADGVVWNAFRWTQNGSVTVTAGVIDTFLISGGGSRVEQNIGGSWASGQGGSSLRGIQNIAAGTHEVVVGVGGTAGQGSWVVGSGKPSRIGTSVVTSYASAGMSSGVNGTFTDSAELFTSITGTSVGYGLGAQSSTRANRGDGGVWSSNVNGSAGVVIIRVPQAFVTASSGWM